MPILAAQARPTTRSGHSFGAHTHRSCLHSARWSRPYTTIVLTILSKIKIHTIECKSGGGALNQLFLNALGTITPTYQAALPWDLRHTPHQASVVECAPAYLQPTHVSFLSRSKQEKLRTTASECFGGNSVGDQLNRPNSKEPCKLTKTLELDY